MAVAQDKRASELTAPVSVADTDVVAGFRPGTGGEPNLDIQMTIGLIRATILAGLAAGTVPIGAQTLTAVGITLSPTTHNNGVIIGTAALTITVPVAATLGYFSCTIIADGAALILDGAVSDLTLADGEIATILTANGKVRVINGLSAVLS